MSSAHRRSVAYSQNFLRSRRLVDRLLERSSIGPDDLVVEIGLDKGAITERLATRCRQVLAIEKDPDRADELSARFAAVGNVAVFEADFLPFPLPITGYKVFASIPFNITSAIVTKLTSGAWPPEDAYLVVQQEAAAKVLGEPCESLSALLLKPWFEPTLVHRFRPTDFVLAPRVEVVLLRLRKRGPPVIDPDDAELFRDVVVFAFTAWQPSVRAAMARILGRGGLKRIERGAGFDLERRPASVRFEECWPSLPRSATSATSEHGVRFTARKHACDDSRPGSRRCTVHGHPDRANERPSG